METCQAHVSFCLFIGSPTPPRTVDKSEFRVSLWRSVVISRVFETSAGHFRFPLSAPWPLSQVVAPDWEPKDLCPVLSQALISIWTRNRTPLVVSGLITQGFNHLRAHFHSVILVFLKYQQQGVYADPALSCFLKESRPFHSPLARLFMFAVQTFRRSLYHLEEAGLQVGRATARDSRYLSCVSETPGLMIKSELTSAGPLQKMINK